MHSGGADPVPVHLVTGLSGAARRTLLQGWLSSRPQGERWAILVDGLPGANGVHPDRASAATASTPDVAVEGLVGGCACCVGGPAFGVAVGRLLRRGSWDRLFIEVSAAANAAALVDRLRAEPLAHRLRVEPVSLVIEQQESRFYMDDSVSGYQHAQDRLALARWVILNRKADTATTHLPALAAHLAGTGPWPRRLITSGDGTVPWEPIARACVTDPTGDPDDPDPRGPIGACHVQWPPAICFDRRRLRSLLDAAVAPGGVWHAAGLRRAHGVFRTERAWYAWRFDAQGLDWRETDWRLDSRLAVLADHPLVPNCERVRLATAITVVAGAA